MLPRIVVDSSDAVTDLCMLGKLTGADKSPYNEVGHRHPYTAVYHMLLSPLRTKAIRFAEIGVAGGASAYIWDAYFPNKDTQICLFDRDANFLENCKGKMSARARFELMDVGVKGDIHRALVAAAGDEAGNYDVIIDDSSHEFPHQINIALEAFPLLKSGGMLIIEDIFRITDEKQYVEELESILPQCAAAYFVVCEHNLRWSPGWDNDKLLVLVKG